MTYPYTILWYNQSLSLRDYQSRVKSVLHAKFMIFRYVCYFVYRNKQRFCAESVYAKVFKI